MDPEAVKDPEALDEADHFRDSIRRQADAHHGTAPLWFGWAIVEAFLAGVNWQKTREGNQ